MRVCVVVLLGFLFVSTMVGCSQIASRDAISRSFINDKFSDIKNIRGAEILEEKTYLLPDGSKVYTLDGCAENEYNAPSPDRDCIYLLEVNKDDTITKSTVVP